MADNQTSEQRNNNKEMRKVRLHSEVANGCFQSLEMESAREQIKKKTTYNMEKNVFDKRKKTIPQVRLIAQNW